MRKKRTPIMLALAGLIASLVTIVSSGTAVAAEYIPPTQWSSVTTNRYVQATNVSPNGNVTIQCETYGQESDLVTYSSSGQVVRQVDRNTMVDGTGNCIRNHAAGRDGDIYGQPWGKDSNGNLAIGTNILAYDGSTLKWKYPSQCGPYPTNIVVGADGNVYFLSNGRLIGLTPEVEPGTSQPKKVLDIPMSGSCYSTQLQAFKDGIAVIGSSGRPAYYTYGGVSLGTTSYGYVGNEFQINAAGRFFNETYTESSGLRSVKVSAYDPMTKKVVWDRTVSADGAYVNTVALHSTPDGGVVAVLGEKKLVGGVQTSEGVMTLVKLNASGGKLWSKTLPNQGTGGSTFQSGGQVRVDSNGNIAVVRNGQQTVNGKSGNVISIGVFDGNGNVVYDEIMRGDLDNSNGSLGYHVSADIAVASNTLYVKAQCQRSCPSYQETRLYPIKVPGLGLDYPRGAVLTVPSPLMPYAALGDSYSSGQGAGVYDTDTVTDTNKCYKSYNGYGRILGRDTSSPLMLTNFAACGGSITDNIDTNTTYPGVTQKQDEVLSSDTKVVSLTIGGNDIGFADVITTCADPTKDCDGAYSLAYNRLGVLDNKLQRVYLDILQKAPNAKVYVLGYPPIVTTGPGCMVGNNGSDYPIFSESRKQKAVDLANSLNTAIQTNVNTIRQLSNYDQRLKFIDAAASSSPFIGHDVCSSDPYVNGLILPPGDSSESFHPNVKGQKAYADLLAANMS